MIIHTPELLESISRWNKMRMNINSNSKEIEIKAYGKPDILGMLAYYDIAGLWKGESIDTGLFTNVRINRDSPKTPLCQTKGGGCGYSAGLIAEFDGEDYLIGIVFRGEDSNSGNGLESESHSIELKIKKLDGSNVPQEISEYLC